MVKYSLVFYYSNFYDIVKRFENNFRRSATSAVKTYCEGAGLLIFMLQLKNKNLQKIVRLKGERKNEKIHCGTIVSIASSRLR